MEKSFFFCKYNYIEIEKSYVFILDTRDYIYTFTSNHISSAIINKLLKQIT